MRQIYECCNAKLMSRYEGKGFSEALLTFFHRGEARVKR